MRHKVFISKIQEIDVAPVAEGFGGVLISKPVESKAHFAANQSLLPEDDYTLARSHLWQ